MSIQKSVIKLSILLLCVFSFNSFAQPRLDLTEGTLFLLGGVRVNYEFTALEKPTHKFDLKSDVGGGYFVLDYLAVGLSIPATWKIAPSGGGSIGLKLFSTYFFDTNSVVFPYLGINVTPSYQFRREFELLAGVDAGVLVSLSESVALDFGIRPEVFFKLYSTQHWKLTIPGGFLGIRAVF